MSNVAPLMGYTEVLQVLADLPVICRETRRRKGLALRPAAAEIGCSFSTLCRIESGEDAVLSNVVDVLQWASR